MSEALNSRPDTSAVTHPDISLASLASDFSTPARGLRIPSTSSRTTAPSSAQLSTPSPPLPSFSRARKGDDQPSLLKSRISFDDGEDAADGDLLDTPGMERKKWGDGNDTPVTSRPKRTRSSVGGTKGVTLTLRDQEKVRNNLYSFYFAS